MGLTFSRKFQPKTKISFPLGKKKKISQIAFRKTRKMHKYITEYVQMKGRKVIPGDCKIRTTSLCPSSFRSLALSKGVLPSSSRRSGLAP